MFRQNGNNAMKQHWNIGFLEFGVSMNDIGDKIWVALKNLKYLETIIPLFQHSNFLNSQCPLWFYNKNKGENYGKRKCE